MRSGRLQVRPRSSRLRCAVCHAVARASAATCDACDAVAHRGCARALVACPSLGCAGALVAPEVTLTPARRRPALLHALSALVLAASTLIFAASTATTSPTPAIVAPPPARLTGIRRAPSLAVDRLRSLDPFVRRDTAVALGGMLRMFSITLPEVEALLLAAAYDPEPSVRARCDAAFVENAERARGHLVRALEDVDPEVRLVAADVLGRVPEAWSRKALLPRLDPQRETDARVRAVVAARSHHVHGSSANVLGALARRARDEPDDLVWVIMRAGLNESRDASCGLVQRTLHVVIDAAARDGRVGAACRDLLGELAPCHSRAPLLETLAADDPATRALAASFLSLWLDEPGVSDALWRACRDDDFDVRLAASTALAGEGTSKTILCRFTGGCVSRRPAPTALATLSADPRAYRPARR